MAQSSCIGGADVRSATRNRAERDRGLRLVSASEGFCVPRRISLKRGVGLAEAAAGM